MVGEMKVVITLEDTLKRFIANLDAGQLQAAGIADVIQERGRQVMHHGYDPAHDDEHRNGEIAISAIAYIQAAHQKHLGLADGELDVFWYFDSPMPEMKKDPRRLLVKAAAMLIAEIDRLDRVLAKASSHGG